MNATPREIDTQLATLRRTPLLIGSVAEHLSEEQLRERSSPQDWSLVEHLAHLNGCAEIWSDDIEQMLALEAPAFEKPHPNKQMARHRQPTFAESARAFAKLRERLMSRLQTLGPDQLDQWEREAIINGRRHTVFTQTRRMALHEAAHAEQMRDICRKIAGLELASG